MLAVWRPDGFASLPQIGLYRDRRPTGRTDNDIHAAHWLIQPIFLSNMRWGFHRRTMRVVFICDDATGFAPQAGYDVDSAAILLGSSASFERRASSGSELLDPDIQNPTDLDRMLGNELPVWRDRWICGQPGVRCDAS